jgi:hypothetical protein
MRWIARFFVTVQVVCVSLFVCIVSAHYLGYSHVLGMAITDEYERADRPLAITCPVDCYLRSVGEGGYTNSPGAWHEWACTWDPIGAAQTRYRNSEAGCLGRWVPESESAYYPAGGTPLVYTEPAHCVPYRMLTIEDGKGSPILEK